MSRIRTALLAVVTGASALTAAQPAAANDVQGVYCGLTALQNDSVTGQTMQGTVSGGPLVTTGDISITCVVRVNGSDVAASGTVTGRGTATVAGDVSYVASEWDDVDICTRVTNHGDAWVICDDVSTISVPEGTGAVCDGATVGHRAWSPCPAGETAATSSSASAPRGAHSTHAHHGGHKKHGQNPAPNPYRPRGTIEISSTLLGIVNYSFTNFDPPFAAWACPPATGTSVTCTPPPPPAGYTHNMCANVAVVTNSVVPGTAHGTSACATPPHATASSTGPSNTPSQAGASPNTSFPWTCAATTVQTVVWTVRCTVGP